ncbi:MAG: hypothetical protein K9L59_03160 [Desulfobacterales bacterium]|nr:hypothetical protein [Desulfobacterales bacterium]
MEKIDSVQAIMSDFAKSTGLSDGKTAPRRYLWTDAFAVCNFLGLFQRTGERRWQQQALDLVEQVHLELGRHRSDDERSGWISGLSEQEGRSRPTQGGLRIGKPLNERRPGEPYDDRLEWDRDGQYYHYLTKWMHALDQLSRFGNDPACNEWAVALAKAAHAGFVYTLPDGSRRMYWKMSIDLSYMLVPQMGQHDPLDGLITYTQLQATAAELAKAPVRTLDAEISEMAEICREMTWETDDPLGIGGLLCDAFRVVQLMIKGRLQAVGLLNDILDAARRGLGAFPVRRLLNLPAKDRLAFRELGMAIGLHALEKMDKAVRENPDSPVGDAAVMDRIERLLPYAEWGESLEAFWLEPENQKTAGWTDHLDINRVMLATSLLPAGYLEL